MSRFEFKLDRGRRLLTVTVRGFWDVQIYRAYDAQIRAELAALRQLPAPQACLIDAREFAVQSREVADLLRDGLAKRLPLYPERTVRLVSSAITRGQASRMTNDPTHQVFDAIEPAMEWLLSNKSQPARMSDCAVAAG